MTETPKRPLHGDPTEALDWADPSDLPLEEVRDVFLTLSKSLRAYQLYDPNNPVYKRFVANLGEALRRVWETRDSLQVLIEEDRFTWMGEEVYRNESRADSLAFNFYRDGIRDMTFEEGVEEREIEGLLEALHRTRNVQGEGEDLVTMLWDLDMDHFAYSAVEVGGDGPGMDLAGLGEPLGVDASTILESELEDDADGVASVDEGGDGFETTVVGAVNTEDFNPTLYALDEEERRHLRGELQEEMVRDLRGDVLSALFDRLEEPDRPDRQTEIIEILRSLVPNFLSRGALSESARVIGEIVEMRSRTGVLSAEALTEGLTDDLSSSEVVEELIRALEDGSVAPDAEELGELLRHLRAEAVTSLLKGAEETRDASVAEVLRKAIQSIAEGNSELVIRLLMAEDPSVVVGAVRLASQMQIAEAGNALVRLLDDGPRQVRKVIVDVAAGVPSSVLAGALQKILRDEDRELRVAAARVLGEMRYAPAADDFRTVIEDKGFRHADVTEKVAFFESFGMLAGEEAIPFLDQILNGRGLLRRREPAEIRAGAALGLGMIVGAQAAEALERASGDDDPVVRSAVVRARRAREGME